MRKLQVGDIVIVKEECLPRNKWQLALVIETTMDKGFVRKVKVAIASSNKGPLSCLERPIHKAVLLVESS